MTYGTNMPVAGLTALPECATVVNSTACLDDSAITPSSTAVLGNHTLSAEITGNYCVQPDPRNITIKIKPITLQPTQLNVYMNRGETDNDMGLAGKLYLGSTMIGNYNGGVIGSDKTWTDATWHQNTFRTPVTYNNLNDSVVFSANDMEEWDGTSGNDSLGSGSSSVSLLDMVNGRNLSDNKYTIQVNTSGGSKGSFSAQLTVQLSE